MNSYLYMMPDHYLPREQTSYNPNDSRLFLVDHLGLDLVPHSLDPLDLGVHSLDHLDHLVLVCHLDSDLACRFLEGSHFSYN